VPEKSVLKNLCLIGERCRVPEGKEGKKRKGRKGGTVPATKKEKSWVPQKGRPGGGRESPSFLEKKRGGVTSLIGKALEGEREKGPAFPDRKKKQVFLGSGEKVPGSGSGREKEGGGEPFFSVAGGRKKEKQKTGGASSIKKNTSRVQKRKNNLSFPKTDGKGWTLSSKGGRL